MLHEFILALLAGILLGTITGLAPGIHINLVASILLASLSLFSSVPLIALAVFIVSMSITHTFIDFIPSVFLGAPEEDTFLSVLPGHEMTMQGKAHEAVVLTLYGSLTAIPIILIFTPLFILFLPSFYNLLKTILPFLLIFISAYLIFREENFLPSLIIFTLAGFLGYAALNLPIKGPLLPLLSGLFGVSSLLVSLRSRHFPRKQEILPLKNIRLPKSEFLKSFFAASISAPLCSFLPGIGSGHAAVIGSEIIPQQRRGFLFLVGSINTIIMAMSFVTIYTINRARSGVAAAVREILKTISPQDMLIIILAIFVTGIIAFSLGIILSKLCALYINKVNYKKLTIIVVFILLLANIVFSNWLGIIVLIASTALGVFCILSNSRRLNLMGCLIIPAIIFYLMN